MELTRNKQHEVAMNIIYQALTYLDMGEDFDIKGLIATNLDTTFEDADIYVKQVTVSAILHREEAIEAFSKNLKNWKFSRLARLMQAILFLSYSHFYYVKDVDKKVVINVAVVLSKKYLNETDYKFVNAILENTLK
ncbi:hypothetical protein SDC9_196281 [bioreactor metagenome]|uniref:NusB/RsmB/TIM44 domain-containing protein n=1 Tax=bioreactor metagenome TaxID=1076179 RepID=A0A645IDY7_9ZZZZ|nr:transcription antitermination factor NusB [Erysipelotrichaceae bacterium]